MPSIYRPSFIRTTNMMSESEKLVDDIDINDVRHFSELPDDTIITVEENGEWVETTVGELKAEEQ
jgi:hypothetical protein